MWGGSSAGRASRSQCEGREFDPPPLHHNVPKALIYKAAKSIADIAPTTLPAGGQRRRLPGRSRSVLHPLHEPPVLVFALRSRTGALRAQAALAQRAAPLLHAALRSSSRRVVIARRPWLGAPSTTNPGRSPSSCRRARRPATPHAARRGAQGSRIAAPGIAAWRSSKRSPRQLRAPLACRQSKCDRPPPGHASPDPVPRPGPARSPA